MEEEHLTLSEEADTEAEDDFLPVLLLALRERTFESLHPPV